MTWTYLQNNNSLTEGNGTPLQYSCLENPMDRGAWSAPVCGVTKSWTQLSNFTFTFNRLTDIENKLMITKGEREWRMDKPGVWD